MTALLLDTCAILWLAGSAAMRPEAIEAIRAAQTRSAVYVSPVSAWELGNQTRQRGDRPPRFLPADGLEKWFHTFMDRPGVRPAVFDADVAIAAATLPPGLHEDPGDRLLVATARQFGFSIVTRGRKILGYAGLGHVAAIPC